MRKTRAELLGERSAERVLKCKKIIAGKPELEFIEIWRNEIKVYYIKCYCKTHKKELAKVASNFIKDGWICPQCNSANKASSKTSLGEALDKAIEKHNIPKEFNGHWFERPWLKGVRIPQTEIDKAKEAYFNNGGIIN